MEYNLENALEQMRAGEEAGLNYIYSKTYNYVYLRAKNILKKESDIQELMKDVYVQALNCSSEIRKENLYEWLGKCVYSLGCQRFRKKKAREAEILELEQNEITSRRGEQSEATMEIMLKSVIVKEVFAGNIDALLLCKFNHRGMGIVNKIAYLVCILDSAFFVICIGMNNNVFNAENRTYLYGFQHIRHILLSCYCVVVESCVRLVNKKSH